jgi:hypothetical protein
MILLVSDENLYQTLKNFENFENCHEFNFKKFRVEDLTFDCKDRLLEKQINLQEIFVTRDFPNGILENILYGNFREMAHSDHFLITVMVN